MLQPHHRSDPIVEIIRLAYRRGLALRQEQEKIESLKSESNSPDGKVWTNTAHQVNVQATEPGKTLS